MSYQINNKEKKDLYQLSKEDDANISYLENEIEKEKSSTLFDKIQKSLNTGSWCEDHRSLYNFARFMSFIFAGISLGSAGVLLGDVAATATQSAGIGFIVGFTVLFCLEWIDRYSSEKAWKAWHFYEKKERLWIGFSLLIFIASIVISLEGEKAGQKKLEASAETIATSEKIERLKGSIKTKNVQISDYRTNDAYRVPEKGKWVISEKIRTVSIPTLEKSVIDLEKQLSKEELKLDGKNNQLTISFTNQLNKYGWIVYLIIGFSGVAYQVTLWFISYWKRRYYNEERYKKLIAIRRDKGLPVTSKIKKELLRKIKLPLDTVDLNF